MMLANPVFAQTTIAALGDSLTQGYGLPQNQGFVPQLERWLTTQGADVRLINAGVSGDTTAGGLSRIDWTLTPDVDALIVALGGNDLLRGLDPALSRENLSAILQKAQDRNLPVLLIGLPAPGNFGPDYKADFDAIYPALAAQYNVLLHPNFLGGLADAPPAEVIQPDGLHPNANGVSLIVQDIGPKALELVTNATTASGG